MKRTLNFLQLEYRNFKMAHLCRSQGKTFTISENFKNFPPQPKTLKFDKETTTSRGPQL